MRNRAWLIYAMLTTVLWGVWGALIELPEKAGFPATLGYTVWALTLLPVTFVALRLIKWKLDHDRRSILLGMGAGLLGCSGQLILFETLRMGPAYIVFPIISLFPVVTIILSVFILKEKASKRSWTGIILALVAILFLSFQTPQSNIVSDYLWLLLTMIVFIMWSLQAYIMKFASDSDKDQSMQAESVTFYTMVSAISLIPIALLMTDFSMNINWGFSGVYSAGLIQSMNAVGFLFFAYALRFGKAIIVVPMMSLAPVVTVIISLIIYGVIPHPITIAGIFLAFVAIYLMAE